MWLSVWRAMTRRKVLTSDELSSHHESDLPRRLGTLDLTALGVGSTLGVGVYVLVGHVARDVAGPAVILSFLIAAITSLFAGLCYAEFGARVPRAGSAYVYSYVCVGEFIAFVIGWNLILEYVIGSASVARGLSLYLDTLLNDTMKNSFRDITPIDCQFLSTYFDFFAFCAAILLGSGLAFGMKESATANNIFTLINVAVVLFVIIAGSFKVDIHNWNIDPATIPPEYNGGVGGFFPFGIAGMVKGAATCFYGFVGFDCIATTGEEVRNPRKAIPFAILLSLTIIFLSYFGVSSIVTLMWPYYLQDANAPIPHVFNEIGWPAAKWIVAIGGMFGLCASLFGAMFPLPRIIYAMASDGLIFRFLGRIHPTFKTPVVGTLMAALLTGLMGALFDLKQLVNMMSIGTLMAYTIVAACVLLLRYSEDDDQGQHISSDLAESTNLMTLKNKSSAHDVVMQIFNTNRLTRPTKMSEKLVTTELCIYGILSLLLSVCLMYSEEALSLNEPWATSVSSILGGIMLLILLSISLQPKSNAELSFTVPFVPLIPGISIFANIYLMLMLDSNTWIRFGIWMIIGFLIYIACLCMHKRDDSTVEAFPSKRSSVIMTNKSHFEGNVNYAFENNITFGNADDMNVPNNVRYRKTSSTDSAITVREDADVNQSYINLDKIEEENEIQFQKERSVFVNSTAEETKARESDLILAMLDAVLNREDSKKPLTLTKSSSLPSLHEFSDQMLTSSPTRKLSAMSLLSNVFPIKQNVVAIVHQEDVISLNQENVVSEENTQTTHEEISDKQKPVMEAVDVQMDTEVKDVVEEPNKSRINSVSSDGSANIDHARFGSMKHSRFAIKLNNLLQNKITNPARSIRKGFFRQISDSNTHDTSRPPALNRPASESSLLSMLKENSLDNQLIEQDGDNDAFEPDIQKVPPNSADVTPISDDNVSPFIPTPPQPPTPPTPPPSPTLVTPSLSEMIKSKTLSRKYPEVIIHQAQDNGETTPSDKTEENSSSDEDENYSPSYHDLKIKLEKILKLTPTMHKKKLEEVKETSNQNGGAVALALADESKTIRAQKALFGNVLKSIMADNENERPKLNKIVLRKPLPNGFKNAS